jgi:hypothetical protein
LGKVDPDIRHIEGLALHEELGKQALQLLGRMHVQGAYQMAMREQVGELVRQLAWGPAS